MRFFYLFALSLLALGSGCTSRQAGTGGNANQASSTAPGSAAPPAIPVQFTDITKAAGIRFKHNNGAFGLSLMPETMGSGVAFIDYDNDGYPDIFFVNGRDWTPAEIAAYQHGNWTTQERRDFKRNHPELKTPVKLIPPHHPTGRTSGTLYHNNGNGTFTDVTKGSGLDIEMYGMGVAVGDYDNDGWPDLYVTAYGRNYLFHNKGKGHFEEVAGPLGVQDSGWSTSATWVDYDRDGKLDLFVCHYVKWSPAIDVYGSHDGIHKGYVRPGLFEGQVSHLYHNEGHRFKEVSKWAGIQWPLGSKAIMPKQLAGKSLGVVLGDYNNDGWPDLAVANDTEPNYLFQNNKDGTFTELGVASGIAFDATGQPRGGMGIDAGDIDHSNRDSIVIGNFSMQMLGLYYNQGKSLFAEIASPSGVGPPSLHSVQFGCNFIDYDNDGWPDILVANGHINSEIHIAEPGVTYAERLLLFRNQGIVGATIRFKDTGAISGDVMSRRIVGRGLACADLDLDGDTDAVVTTNGGPPILLRNDGGNKNNSIRLILQGTKSNRSAIGAVIKLLDEKVRRAVRGGSSYLSQSELPVTIGLGQKSEAQKISILWPDDKLTTLQHVPTNQIITVNEDKGIVRQKPFAHPK